MRGVPAAVRGILSPILPLRLSIVLATVCLLTVLGGAAYSGPGAQQQQAAQGTTLTADEIKALRQRAEQGDADAQCNLGAMYDLGRGVPQDYAQAAVWYRKAAAQGDAQAQFAMGSLYQSGQGVPENYAQAAVWFRQAAEQGHAKAQYAIGGMYERGLGVPQDDVEALSWFRKAAEQGDAAAQHSLGWMYEDGRGVPQDYIEAHKWLNLAAARAWLFQKNSVASRDALAKRMTPAQIAEAQKRASEWLAAFEKRK